MKKLRSLSDAEQAVVQAMKDRHILEPLVKDILPSEKLKRGGYGLCLCPDKDHLIRRIKFYTDFFEAERHPITEHGGGAALAIRTDNHLRYKFQEFLFTAVRKGTQVFLVETHLPCALVQDTWDIDPWTATVKHHESIHQIKELFRNLVGNHDLLMEHYLEYTCGAVIKADVKKALVEFRPEEIEIFPAIDTYRVSDGKCMDRTYKLCRSKLIEYRQEMDEIVPQILASQLVSHSTSEVVPCDRSFVT